MSKRCCPVCAYLLYLLNKHHTAKFIVSDEHTNIRPCALPEWLPEEIVYMMVMEFSHRLREELTSLQSISQQRGWAGTSDTGRMSTDSDGSQEIRRFEENVVAFAFDTRPSMDSLLEWQTLRVQARVSHSVLFLASNWSFLSLLYFTCCYAYRLY